MEIISYRLHNSNKVMTGLVKKAPVGFYQPLRLRETNGK